MDPDRTHRVVGPLSEGRIVVLGLGTGHCGTDVLAGLLDRQPDASVSFERPPLLSWRPRPAGPGIAERIERLLDTRRERVVGDVASFYLPYVEEAIRLLPGIRIICLERPREEVLMDFSRQLDSGSPLPMNHWSPRASRGQNHDPIWTRTFPQYESVDRDDGIRRYWDDYHEAALRLADRHPENFRLYRTEEALGSEAGVDALLSFAGFGHDRVSGAVDIPRVGAGEAARPSPSAGLGSDAGKCTVLVPYSGSIVAGCDESLRELERRGYRVFRIAGYAAIDEGRNQMATDALIAGFEEIMWIDSDIVFDPDAVDRLRSHDEPIVCGIYAQKGRRKLACHAMPGTDAITLGKAGGLVEILYAGAGFLLIRREVFSAIQRDFDLPVCNESFGRPTIPFFQPLVRPQYEGHWYLPEDYAFCERARRCGYRIMADTTLRLGHVGQYTYNWEDTAGKRRSLGNITIYFS